MKNKIKILFELTKIKITSFVTLTTAFGYICFTGEINSGMITPVFGILLLACGSAVINHYQERKTDALMDRTKNRPIPSGRISSNDALIIALVLILTGSIILYSGAGILALSLALLNLIWYNGIYTPLKKKNPLAIVPGSLVGAIPPAVGWVAGGGSVFDSGILIISFFFFIWQIPHFWLLLLVFDKDYEKAGFPTLTKIFSHTQLARITFVWIIATGVTGLIIPLFGITKFPAINFLLLAAGIWLGWNAFKLLKETANMISFRFAFREINVFALLVIILLSIDKLFI
ncbi:MAG: protoheme IX farnesyltransferase [Ignavibacteria bacterium]|nr:protoheme IX farnesyltransferase [Ignavibacteria bacterium]